MNSGTTDAKRRMIFGAAAAAGLMTLTPGGAQAAALPGFGQMNKVTAKPGMREQLIKVMPVAVEGLADCLAYMASEDEKEPGAFWVVEFWTSEAAHAQAMTLPHVKEGVALGRSMVAKFEHIASFTPVGGAVGKA
jgi:quinol monooxygenase YgiN